MTNSIIWFRNNLRVNYNSGLSKALEHNNCFPIYIHNENQAKPIGAASKVWLHHALKDLNLSLNNTLSLFDDDPLTVLSQLIKEHNITDLYIDKTYDPDIDSLDNEIIKLTATLACKTHIDYDRTLWDLPTIFKPDQSIFTVFTPFYKRGCLNSKEPSPPTPTKLSSNCVHDSKSLHLTDLLPLPKKSWVTNIISEWDISEKGGQNRWQEFIKTGLPSYKIDRDFPAKPNVSKLSPYIHFGQISIQQLYFETKTYGEGKDRDHFISELAWREFAYYLLFHRPSITTDHFQPKFNHFDWTFDESLYKAWCYGNTGYPIVDAGMRQLYQTGYMHNRLRMICGSLLVKNCRIHWKHGEAWFWDCLFDADKATNAASWQWVAGTGTDAAAYVRIFNPMLQSKKFDPTGTFIKHYVPELSNLPTEYLAEPWSAPSDILAKAGITLGENYPFPIVDFIKTRDAALTAFEKVNQIERRNG